MQSLICRKLATFQTIRYHNESATDLLQYKSYFKAQTLELFCNLYEAKIITTLY